MKLAEWVALLVVLGQAAASAELPAKSAYLERLWNDLAGDAGPAYQAIWGLVKTPGETTQFIDTRLSPVVAPDPQKVQKLIADLSSPRFAVRQQAHAELTRLGGLAEAALRQALSSGPTLEATQRIEKLLSSLSEPVTIPAELRALRAIETLEHIATEPARKLLERYAAGANGARLTEDAKQALQHLKKAAPPAAPPEAARTDAYGDPLPPGALRRMGTLRFRRPDHFLRGFAMLPGGKSLLTVSSRVIQVWEVPSGRLQRSLDLGPVWVSAFALTPDGKTMAVSLHDSEGRDRVGETRVLELASGKLLGKSAHGDNLALSADGKLLFCFSRENQKAILRIEEIDSGKTRVERSFGRALFSTALALSGDGKFVMVGNNDDLFLWRWQGEDPRKLPVPPSRYASRGVRQAAFSPDSQLLAAVTENEDLVVWDVPSGRMRHQTERSSKGRFVGRPVFAPDGKTLAVPLLSYKGVYCGIELVEPATGHVLGVLEGDLNAAAISENSRLLAGATNLGVRFWDLQTRQEMWANQSAPASAAYEMVTAGRLLITVNEDDTVRVWDSSSGKEVYRYMTEFGTWVAVSPDQKLLAAATHDDAVHVWDLSTGREKYRLIGHGRLGGRYLVGFQSDTGNLLSFGEDWYLRVWDMKTGKARQEHAIRPKGIPIPEPNEEDDDSDLRVQAGRTKLFVYLRSFGRTGALTPDGKKFLLLARDGLRIFDTHTGKEMSAAAGATSTGDGLAFSPDSKLALVRRDQNDAGEPSVSLLDLGSRRVLQSFRVSIAFPGPMAFAADGRMFALACTGPRNEIVLYETASGKVRARIQGFDGHVSALVFLQDGRRLASGLSDSSVLIWDLSSPALLQKEPSP